MRHDFRPDRLGKLERVGRYDEATRSFIVTEIPAPPEARTVEINDPVKREQLLGYELRYACPCCHHDTVIRFHQRYQDPATRERDYQWSERQDAERRHRERMEVVEKILDAYDPEAAAEVYDPTAVLR